MPRPASRSRCPVCGAPAQPSHAPFCSPGCKDRDLLRWLNEDYRLPGERVDPEEAQAAQSRLDSPNQRD
jgi:endogenous inhibitor of DNA gyrase (YacG/DUF329 family)